MRLGHALSAYVVFFVLSISAMEVEKLAVQLNGLNETFEKYERHIKDMQRAFAALDKDTSTITKSQYCKVLLSLNALKGDARILQRLLEATMAAAYKQDRQNSELQLKLLGVITILNQWRNIHRVMIEKVQDESDKISDTLYRKSFYSLQKCMPNGTFSEGNHLQQIEYLKQMWQTAILSEQTRIELKSYFANKKTVEELSNEFELLG